MFEVQRPEAKKALWRRALPFATAGAALTLAGTIAATYPTFDRSLERAFNPRSQAEMNSNVRRVIGAAESRGYTTIQYDGNAVSIDSDQVDPRALTIARSDAPVLDRPYADMGRHAEAVQSDLKWVVFSPDVENEDSDVDGLSIGDGIIYRDTVADDGRPKDPRTTARIMAHESDHEANKGKNLSTLASEGSANRRAQGVLEEQLSLGYSDVVQAQYDSVNKRVDTADFLEGFGTDFQNVYPGSVILAKDLLEADVPADTLQKYVREPETESGLERELIMASNFADMVRSLPREQAIQTLYENATNPEYENTLRQVSAASALSYLFPNELEEHSTADVPLGSDRFASISFGPPDSSGAARAVSGGGFSVRGLPTLADLLNPQEEETPEGTFTNVELYDGDTVRDGGRKYIAFGNKRLLIPDKEGKPGSDWIVVAVEALDLDQNGLDETITIQYTNPRLLESADGITIAKVDKYRGMTFQGSSLIRLGYTFNEASSGLDFVVERDLQDRVDRWIDEK